MEITEALQRILDPKGILLGEDVKARPNLSWGQGQCPAKALIRPASTEELSQVMTLCHDRGQTVVPWGSSPGQWPACAPCNAPARPRWWP